MQVKDRAVCAQKELFMGKVTNKDIAERAGVSAAAVSLAIHGRKGISEATRANILRIVQEMNYAPPSRSCTDSRAVVLIPGTGLRMPPPALLQGIADFAAQQRAQLHILTLQQLMEDFPAKLTGCMLLVTFDEQSDGKTVLTLRQMHPSKAQRDGAIGFGAVEYGGQTLAKLERHLTKRRGA